MIDPGFEILNQRGTPMFFSDVFANRPTAGVVGRIFISTDTNLIYRDTGTTWNLIGGGSATIGGTIAAGQVAFGTALDTIGGSNNLFYDSSNARLGIGTASPQTNIQISDNKNGITSLQISNTTAGISSQSGVRLDSDASAGTMNIGKYSSTTSSYLTISSRDGYLSNASFGDITIQNEVATGRIKFSAGAASTSQITLFSNGNLGINVGLTDGGQRLQVSGDTLLRGSGNTSATTALTVQNSNSTNLFTVRNDGFVNITNTLLNGLSVNSSNYTTRILINNTNADPNAGFELQTNGVTNWAFANYKPIAATNASFVIYNQRTLTDSVFINGDTNNVGINTNNPTARLDVRGDTLLRGSGNTSATTALTVQNSDGNPAFIALNNRHLRIYSQTIYGSGQGTIIGPFAQVSSEFSITGINLLFYNYSVNNTSEGAFLFNGADYTATSGIQGGIKFSKGFWPTSGTSVYNALWLNPIINQTGGANGITRGIYVNPTLTAAADWRSIEWSNNTGWGLYGAGTTANFLSGNLLLGSATPFTANEKLQVTGTQQNKHTITYSTGAVQSFRIQKDLTIGSGATISSASTLSNAVFTGDNIFGGNVTIPESSPFANVYGANYYQFNAAGITITQTQATGKRTLTQYYAQNYFKGSNSGTITDMSSIQIAGWYNNNTGSITPTITNAYQLLIADIGEYGHTFTLTNRWGIYQEGASDRNYMAGKLMLNTTTDTGQRIQINGDIRIDGQTSGTAGGSSGQHLIINCDGTTYKIALLNN